MGQSNDRGDGGIYIGSIMKGGAVAADGRIEPGDMLLQVNDEHCQTAMHHTEIPSIKMSPVSIDRLSNDCLNIKVVNKI